MKKNENSTELEIESNKFKNEIAEIPLSDIYKAKQFALEDNEDKNEDLKETPQEIDAIGGEKISVQQGEEKSTPNPNDATSETEETKEIKIEKRGRKPLTEEEKNLRATETKDETKIRIENLKKTGEQGQNSLNEDLKKYKKVQAPESQQVAEQKKVHKPNEKVNLSEFISGALFLIALDVVAPTIFLTLTGFFDKRYKAIDKQVLRLTAEEKKQLEPLAEKMVQILFGEVNPILAFGVVVGLMYIGKIMMITDEELDLADAKKYKKTLKKTKV